MIYQTDFFGNSTLGLIGILTEDICYLPSDLKEKQIENIAKLLDVKIKITTFYNSFLLGLFGAANSKYLFIPSIVSDEEVKGLEKNILKIESLFNTLGNLILCNDKGIVLSPYLAEKKDFFEHETKLKVEITTIANLPFPGILGLVTNKAGIVHKNCKDEELDILEKTLEVKFHRCEFYEGFPGAEILANSKGLIAPKYLKAQELAEIQENLDIY
jgi:translation initiation factor 6 (eIF-6)